MKTSDFDFPLPESLIASTPLPNRDASRLLVLREKGTIEDRHFNNLEGYLEKGDILLLNNTKVLPFRLRGMKQNGRHLDILLVRNISGDEWEIMSRGKYTGELAIADDISASIKRGERATLRFSGNLEDMLWKFGEMPLPPYIKRRADAMDKTRYQTVYAESEGSIAAPTAGLHFTRDLLARLRAKGVLIRYLTLHVGRGTFTPIRAANIHNHKMETEHFQIEHSLVDEIRDRHGRLITVGTTATRAIEGYLSGNFSQEAGRNGTVNGTTDIFIYPGYRFRAVDCLLTNFHLPRSTPLMLASAFCGYRHLINAYEHAIRECYRFFSYGDAMLIFRTA